MSPGRVAIPKRKSPSSSHWDHVAFSESDTNTPTNLPPEYADLARKLITAKAGADAALFGAMLGLTEGESND